MGETKSGWRATVETLGSMKLGVALIVAVAAASAIGTVVLQASPDVDARELRGHYGAIADALMWVGLTDVFHSAWFAVLLGLLALNVLAATVARFALRLDRIGMLLAHAGILVALAGGLTWSLLGDKGIVRVAEGDTADRYTSRRNARDRRLPFTLHLNRFIVEHYPARLIAAKSKDLALAATAREGLELAPDWTTARVTVERVIAQAEPVVEVREDENGPINPAAHIRLQTDGKPSEFWLFARRESPVDTLLQSNGRIAVAFDNELTATRNDLPIEPRAYAINRETGRTVEIPVKPGQGFSLPNAENPAWGEIVAVPQENDNSSLGPPLCIRIMDDNDALRHAYAWQPGFNPDVFQSRPVPLPELDFVYYRPTLTLSVLAKAGPPASFELRTLAPPSGEWRAQPLALDAPATVDGATLTLLEALQRATVDSRWVPSIERTPQDGSGQAEIEAALVRVDWPGGPARRYWLATTMSDRAVRVGAALVLALSPSDHVRDFRADVALGDNDSGESALIRVNDPAGFRGWQIFLGSPPSPMDPDATFLVSRDPGLPLVYAGLALLALGVFVACFVKGKETSASADDADDADSRGATNNG